jgi:hypothetical protein
MDVGDTSPTPPHPPPHAQAHPFPACPASMPFEQGVSACAVSIGLGSVFFFSPADPAFISQSEKVIQHGIHHIITVPSGE